MTASGMSSKKSFSLKNYDCIGFDLDNTLALYNVFNLTKLNYGILCNYLVERVNYSQKITETKFEDILPFAQRGLVFDFERGNTVKLNQNGFILKCYHGTKEWTAAQIEEAYGIGRVWDDGKLFAEDMLSAWNGPLSCKARATLSYFDVASLLVWANVVDVIENTSNCEKDYKKIWKSILDGLNYMYNWENFKNNTGEFFPALKREPNCYLKKCPPEFIEWLNNLRKIHGKFVFLITGSAVDFATFTANYILGPEWHKLFDFTVFFAKKPNFFIGERSFLEIDENELVAKGKCNLTEDTKMASQGNWKEMMNIVRHRTGKEQPRSLYVGDSAVEDVLAPNIYNCCDTLAIIEELTFSNDAVVGPSKIWGSYFEGESGKPSMWYDLINNHASLCVNTVQILAENSMEFEYNTENSVFFPEDPINRPSKA